MDDTIRSKSILEAYNKKQEAIYPVTNLANAEIDREYIIKDVQTNDEEMKNFLFTLGCYAGETVTVLSVLAENYVISVKDARYSIDSDLAETIII
ncbi:FeoA family protein [Vallitalea okinawensis]|uniref:FeoA family protein n=1 Tax=Vallitalea okinawensis TaxID=2078660 RepID=UPI000CFC23F4|nr:FeoA family protein [Vallitalea okinawensis]